MNKKMIWKGILTPLRDYNTVIMKIGDAEFWGNLPLYLDEVNHSPTGFSWGFYGSGPSQLAYAILRSYYVFVESLAISEAIRKAKNHYMRFKQDFVAKWHGEEWEVTSDQVAFWLSTEKENVKEGWV